MRRALALVACIAGGLAACEDPAKTRARVFEAQRRDTYERCLAHGALDNYRKQCERVGGKILVVRHTFVCFGEGNERNPQGLGDGPYCTCHQRDGDGRCLGDADCDGGVREKCEPLLTAELVPYYKPPAARSGEESGRASGDNGSGDNRREDNGGTGNDGEGRTSVREAAP